MSLFNRITNMFNTKSGQGGDGDFSGGHIGARMRLPAVHIEAMTRTEPLLRNAMAAPGEDIIRAWRTFSEDNRSMVEVEELLDYKSVVEKAVFYSECFGGCLVVPAYDAASFPLSRYSTPFVAPRRGTLIGFRLFMPHQLGWPSDGSGMETRTQFANGLPEVFELRDHNGAQRDVMGDTDHIRIHNSWTIPVHGEFRTDSFTPTRMANCEVLFGESRADMVYEHLTRAIGALANGSHQLAKANIDVMKLQGIAQAISQCTTVEEMQDALKGAMLRAGSAAQGGSVYQPLVLDADESFDRASIGSGLGGAKDLIEMLLASYAAVTRVPRTRLLGEQSKGLGNGGEADLTNFYDWVAGIRERRVTRLLNQMDRFAALDGGFTPPDNWEYMPLYTPQGKELAEIEKIKAERDAIYAGLGLPFLEQKIVQNLDVSGTYEFSSEEMADVNDLVTPRRNLTGGEDG